MNVYRVTVPVQSNKGHPYPFGTHQAFFDVVLNTAGGYTSHLVQGAWRDPATKKIYEEQNFLVEFAILPEHKAQGLADIRYAFARAFPDQVTLYLARIGTAEILPNTEDVEGVHP